VKDGRFSFLAGDTLHLEQVPNIRRNIKKRGFKHPPFSQKYELYADSMKHLLRYVSAGQEPQQRRYTYNPTELSSHEEHSLAVNELARILQAHYGGMDIPLGKHVTALDGKEFRTLTLAIRTNLPPERAADNVYFTQRETDPHKQVSPEDVSTGIATGGFTVSGHRAYKPVVGIQRADNGFILKFPHKDLFVYSVDELPGHLCNISAFLRNFSHVV